MRQLRRYLIAIGIICAASACSNGPGPQAIPHPPVADLRVWPWGDPSAPAGACTDEPPAPDPDDPATTTADLEQWETDVLLSGRGCRDTVARICEWHRANGSPGACGR